MTDVEEELTVVVVFSLWDLQRRLLEKVGPRLGRMMGRCLQSPGEVTQAVESTEAEGRGRQM